MRCKYILMAAAFALLSLTTASAYAENSIINLKISADMPTLRDKNKQDTFVVTVIDGANVDGQGKAIPQIKTVFGLKCQAGSSKWGGLKRTDEACAVAGTGSIINPNNKQELPRVKYSGGLVVKSDGVTDGRSIIVNYLTLGTVPASSDTFGGTLILKPEVPSGGALDFGKNVIEGLKKKVAGDGTTIIDDRTDTIEFSNFATPSAGMPSDKGCVWRGSGVYAYQTSSWFFKLEGTCNGKAYNLIGNMPWTDTDDGNARYDLTLTLPSAKVASDDALFADSASNGDLFAQADGISGSLIMKLGATVTVKVDGKDEEVPSSIEAEGSLNGQNVPVEVVRSLSSVMAVLSRTFFGS